VETTVLVNGMVAVERAQVDEEELVVAVTGLTGDELGDVDDDDPVEEELEL